MRSVETFHADLDNVPTVQAADPLAADPICAQLPAMNHRADLTALVGGLRSVLPELATVPGFTVVEALAAMRDLGFFLASIRRHGPEPVVLLPEATPVLLALGEHTDMVPRDTILHYTAWNPTGPRQRRYTDDVQEDHLQESVRMVYTDVYHGIETCAELHAMTPTDPAFGSLMNEFADRLAVLVGSMNYTLEHVSPRFFAEGLRPYLESVQVAGHDYFGPAAAQVPLWLIDEATWSADRPDPQYESFWRALVPYALPRWREHHARWDGRPSIVTRLVAASVAEPDSAVLRAAAEATVRALRTIVTFRGRHLGIASQVYELETQEYSTGSGGGSVDLLREIMNLTKLNARLVRQSAGDPPRQVVPPARPGSRS